jgi:hypothetical protein
MYVVISSIELSCSWEATSHSVTQDFPNVLQNPKVHYRVHKSPPFAPILNQMNPIQITSFYSSNIHFNIILHLRLGLSSGLFPSGFHTKILYAFLFAPKRATCSDHIIFLNLIILIIFDEKYKLRSSSSCNFLPTSFHFSHLWFKCSQHPVFKYFLLLISETKFHTHTKLYANL